MVKEIIGFQIGGFNLEQTGSNILWIFIASSGDLIIIKEANQSDFSLRMTFFKDSRLRTLSYLAYFFINSKKINYRFSFIFDKEEKDSLSGTFTYYGDKIYSFPFPLTEEEYLKSNFWRLQDKMIDLRENLIKIPFLAYRDDGRDFFIKYTIPIPKINWPKNQFEKIAPASSPLEVIDLIDNLGFGVIA